MQASRTLRKAGDTKGAWLWLVVLIAGMLLAGAGGYLAHASSTTAGTSSHVHATAAPAASEANEPQNDGGLQR